MGGYGQAYRQLGYEYNLPTLAYKPEPTWGAWDIANAQYSGGRLERSFFDNIISTLTNFFATRHLSEGAARDAHRRVYSSGEGEDAGNKTLGGAAAYQAYLLWDRDHHTAFHSYPSQENRERLVGLAVAELFSLWDRVQPRSSRVNVEEASQYAAATAKYLFDRHYDLPGGHHHHPRSRFSGYGADDESDTESESRRMRRRSMYGQMPPYAMQQGMGSMGGSGMAMMPGEMMPNGGMGMPGGYGGMPIQGPMQGMGMPPGAMAMGGGMGGMGVMSGVQTTHGMLPEAQAAPGMHPYTYGAQSGVAYGNQPIDPMGNPTFPGGPGMQGGRGWYAYGDRRYY
ncbi:hypothetical protein EHS25_010019 [Saitozyma podzolica]|uniref:DUF7721 domain-containing protein n=1 Tax=Saitozyma podzolica TaxID=1890683 RepID=A0A427YIC9_9TREE|nr:hypothetical protein EHS25_010019 [Saitozyma podzolica]